MWALHHRHLNLQTHQPPALNPTNSPWETPRTPFPPLPSIPRPAASPSASRTCRPGAGPRSGEFQRLCRPGVPSSHPDRFFATWPDPADPKSVQSNALAWFQYATGLASTALGTAVGCGWVGAVRVLLDKGLEPAAMDVFWALRASDENGDRTAGELFVDAGWDVDRPANEYTAPILGLRNLTRARLDVLRFLVDHGTSPDTLYMSQSKAWRSSSNVVFVQYGQQKNLHLAISEGNRGLAKTLLALGADKEMEMFSLKTGLRQIGPRELARFLGRDDIAGLLGDGV